MLTLAQELKGTGVTANLLLVRTIDVKHERDREPTPRNAFWTTPEEIAACANNGISPVPRVHARSTSPPTTVRPDTLSQSDVGDQPSSPQNWNDSKHIPAMMAMLPLRINNQITSSHGTAV